jgi:hypothetical protein
MRPARVDGGLLHFAEGSNPDEKTLPDTAGQQPWCDQISTLAKNQLYPFSEHTCAHRHSHGSRKLPVIEGR